MPALTLLHTEWSDGWGGQERRVFSEMQGMRARGHRVLLATRAGSTLGAHAEQDGFVVYRLAFAGKFHLPTIFALWRHIRQQRVDVVSSHSGIDSWCAALAARMAGVALVRTRHIDLPMHASWLNFVHFLPDRIVTCGEAMRTHLLADNPLPPERLVSIPTGIDFDRLQAQTPRASLRLQLGLGNDDRAILMVAILRGVKRHMLALEALARLRLSHPQARLLLAGEGPMRAELEEHARALQLSGQVTFLGHREDVADLLAASDVLLLSSRSEGIPQSVVQAMGSGLPVVATRVGGLPELIDDGQNGLLVPAEDATAMAAALQRLLDAPDLAQRLAAAARDKVRERYSYAAMLDATEKMLQDILLARRQKART